MIRREERRQVGWELHQKLGASERKKNAREE